MKAASKEFKIRYIYEKKSIQLVSSDFHGRLSEKETLPRIYEKENIIFKRILKGNYGQILVKIGRKNV